MVILAISPFFASLGTEMSPRGMSAPGRKKGIFGRDRAKTGQPLQIVRRCTGVTVEPALDSVADACRSDRCYEPAGADLIVAIPAWNSTIPEAGMDCNHEFVIGRGGRNKLKDRLELQSGSARART
jgi:hypothetical protein